MNSHNQQLPSGIETLNSLAERISASMKSQLEDTNSPFSRHLVGKTFQNETLIQLAIQDAFHDIWKSGGDIAADFGFLGDSMQLEINSYSVRSELDTLASQVTELIRPAIIHDATSRLWKVDFSSENTNKIVDALERQKKGIHNAKYLMGKEVNQIEKAALDRILAALKQAPARLKSELKKARYPARVTYDQFTEGKVFKAIESTVLTAAFGFMTYGWHGLTYNGLDYLTRNSRNNGSNGGIPEMIISNPIAMNGITWGAGFFAASLIGYGLIRGARTKREYLIQDAEATEKNGQKTTVGNIAQRNAIFALSVLTAVGGAMFEGAGILAHEVQGIYTAQKAYEVGKAIDSILDITNSGSPAGKAYLTYQDAPKKIKTQAESWYNAELHRPGASGVGPAAKAKQYLQDGNTVLADPVLARDQNLLGLAQSAETNLANLSPKSHTQNYTFALKAEAVRGSFEDNTNFLKNRAYGDVTYSSTDGKIATGLYSSVYKKGTSAKTPDFLAAKDAFEKDLQQYEENQKARTDKWRQITGVYQDYITRVSATADAKYRSSTAFDAKIEFEIPDLSELKKKVAEVPKLEGKTPLEYWDELNNLVGKEGGISEADRVGIITLITLRSGVIEALSALFLFLGLRKVRNYYSRSNNLLSKKEKNLVYGYYEQLVEAIQNTFSGSNWQGIFPGHEGLGREEAEYLARILVVTKDPTLSEWLPIRQGGIDEGAHHTKRILHNAVGVVNNIITGNTQTSQEAYLAKLNTVLTQLSVEATKDKSGIGIPLQSILQVIGNILPSPNEIGKGVKSVDISSKIVSDIAGKLDVLASLASQTIEHHADEGSESISRKVQEIQDWTTETLEIWIAQCENSLRNSKEEALIESLSNFIGEMKGFQNGVTGATQPNFQDIITWNKTKHYLESKYKNFNFSDTPTTQSNDRFDMSLDLSFEKQEEIYTTYLKYIGGKDYSINPENLNTLKYVFTLNEIITHYGVEALVSLKNHIRQNFNGQLTKILPFGDTFIADQDAWIYWDIAKQYHLFKNPSGSNENYTLANPMEDKAILNDIVARQIGWEVSRDNVFSDLAIKALVGQYPKNKLGDYPSHVLTKIGYACIEQLKSKE